MFISERISIDSIPVYSKKFNIFNICLISFFSKKLIIIALQPKEYACCILVKGSKRASITDTQRFCLYLIPLDLYNILKDGVLDFNKLKQIYENEILNEYLNFLEENKLGFWTNHPNNFPPIAPVWDSPSLITNAIVDIGTNIDYVIIFNV